MNNIQQENTRLKAQLQHAQEWMRREIEGGKHDHSEVIEEKIYRFFPAESLSHFPNSGVDNIISAELIYQHLLEGENIDGIGVILSYQKVLDEMVELYITKGFRKYIKKHAENVSHINDPLEKSLRLIVDKKYILSLGRLYQILSILSSGAPLSGFTQQFSLYLKSRVFLEKSLLESTFSLQLKRLIDLHAITDKRHSGTLSKPDTTTARKLIIGDFLDTECLLYTISASQNTDM